ncbi:hypothetical protein [Celeribacter marinus]|uniref:hypothetical protein n=1 Tax=Celeribacter marinus TaxID=1397108 RepID=UPI00316B2537
MSFDPDTVDRDQRPGTAARRIFNLTERQKAELTGMSLSYLQKDRLRPEPRFAFKKYGRSVRYSVED